MGGDGLPVPAPPPSHRGTSAPPIPHKAFLQLQRSETGSAVLARSPMRQVGLEAEDRGQFLTLP
eukprot:5840977-Alexandrium_andersonii.AAC.1